MLVGGQFKNEACLVIYLNKLRTRAYAGAAKDIPVGQKGNSVVLMRWIPQETEDFYSSGRILQDLGKKSTKREDRRYFILNACLSVCSCSYVAIAPIVL
jgi:hypothetical protein